MVSHDTNLSPVWPDQTDTTNEKPDTDEGLANPVICKEGSSDSTSGEPRPSGSEPPRWLQPPQWLQRPWDPGGAVSYSLGMNNGDNQASNIDCNKKRHAPKGTPHENINCKEKRHAHAVATMVSNINCNKKHARGNTGVRLTRGAPGFQPRSHRRQHGPARLIPLPGIVKSGGSHFT